MQFNWIFSNAMLLFITDIAIDLSIAQPKMKTKVTIQAATLLMQATNQPYIHIDDFLITYTQSNLFFTTGFYL